MQDNRRIRVALVHYRDHAAAGGSLRVGQNLAHCLDPQKVEAHLVFAYGGPGPVSRQARVPHHFLQARGYGDFSSWMGARAFMKQLSPDVIHFMDPIVWLYTALLPSRYIKFLHLHGRPGPSLPTHAARMSWLERFASRAIGRLADGQICITHATQRACLQLGWACVDRTWTVHNAVNCRDFEDLSAQAPARQQLGLPPRAKLLGMVCRLVPYRGCDDALRLLQRLGPAWHLVFCGEGPLRPGLEAIVERDCLRERVHFTGLLDDVRPAYAALDAFVFLARYEACGLAICEAMAAEVPVFGLGGDGDYREPEYPLVTSENAVFVERSRPYDYEASEAPEVLDQLARRIEDYGERPHCYRAMTERARSWVQARFDAPLQAQAVTSAYQRVLKRS